MTKKFTGILWEGPSLVDQAPIVVIVTGPSANVKTGPMLQTWILRSDIAPLDALRTGDDVSICGTCPHRAKKGDTKTRSCYVNVGQAPRAVYKAYKEGKYKPVAPEALAGQAIRFGAYGEPVLIPQAIVEKVIEGATTHTGYTHMWRQPFAEWAKGKFMASVDNLRDETLAFSQGWSTFRVGMIDKSDIGDSRMCLNDSHDLLCIQCKLCDGSKSQRIFIGAHGAQAKNVPVEALVRKKTK